MAGPNIENTIIPWDQEQIDGDQLIGPYGLTQTHRGATVVGLETGDKRKFDWPTW